MAATLFLAALLVLFSDVSQGQGVPECTCGSTLMDECFGAPCYEVHCSSIDSATKVQCASQFLANVTAAAPGVPLRVILSVSTLDVFPDDFLASYDIIGVEFNQCPMTEVPHRLIDPVASTLLDLEIYECDTLAALLEGEFSSCPNLQKLYLVGDGIAEVPTTAFVGLASLQTLYLGQNRLDSFGGLDSLENLALLDLSNNQITSVAKEAFQSLGQLAIINLQDNSLTTLEQGTFDPLLNSPIDVDLEGNPLNCDCNLKWLQDWVIANDSNQLATCATPVEGPLVDADFTACQRNPLNCDCALKWLQEWTIDNNVDKRATCNIPQKIPVVDATFELCPSSAHTNRKFLTEVLASSSMLIFVIMFLNSV